MTAAPDPGCEVCRTSWQRRATVFDQYGFSRSRRTLLYRCAVCDTRWEATVQQLLPLEGPFPDDREPATAVDLGPALADQASRVRPSPPEALPSAVRVGPIASRTVEGGRIVVPFAQRIPGSWVGTPLDSFIAPLAAIALALDALLPDVDVHVGWSYRFDAVTYRDRLGGLHTGYGLALADRPSTAAFERLVLPPVRRSPADPPDPIALRVDEGSLVRMGLGVDAPTHGLFNVVAFGLHAAPTPDPPAVDDAVVFR